MENTNKQAIEEHSLKIQEKVLKGWTVIVGGRVVKPGRLELVKKPPSKK